MVHGLETMKRLNDNEVRKSVKRGRGKKVQNLPKGDAFAVRRLENRPWTQEEMGKEIGRRSPFRGKDVL
jgi:hypothetical protein